MKITLTLDTDFINELQIDSIIDFLKKSKYMSRADIIMRRNGEDIYFQADWLKNIRYDDTSGRIAKQIAIKYQKILEDRKYETDLNEFVTHEHLVYMCSKVIECADIWDDDKLNRCIGYIQGVLSSFDVANVTEHRDIVGRIILENNQKQRV